MRRQPAQLKTKFLSFLALAGLSHGLFNTLTFSPGLRVLSALLILIIWAWGIRTLEKQPKATASTG